MVLIAKKNSSESNLFVKWMTGSLGNIASPAIAELRWDSGGRLCAKMCPTSQLRSRPCLGHIIANCRLILIISGTFRTLVNKWAFMRHAKKVFKKCWFYPLCWNGQFGNFVKSSSPLNDSSTFGEQSAIRSNDSITASYSLNLSSCPQLKWFNVIIS